MKFDSKCSSLTNQNGSDKYVPKYSQGASSYSIRAPTGVDLALGLSGYDKLGKTLPPERTPTTLQPLKDSDGIRLTENPKKFLHNELKRRKNYNYKYVCLSVCMITSKD